ncbi:hypothetical protein MFLAVUS_005910 [Mucor flavus]|uniref:Uncharacterized protein n=1 Tax=Mucor flavus TaxID=439312 RepID=A0ABP9Z014_9FUNG
MRFNSLTVSRDLALAIILTDLSFPRRNDDLDDIFGMSGENIPMVINGKANVLIKKFRTGLEFDRKL